jgi:hypothetical protein
MSGILSLILRVCALFACFYFSAGQAAVTLSDFSNFAGQTPFAGGSWATPADQFIQNNGNISITSVNGGNPRDDGDFLVSPASPFSIGSLNQISLTLRIDSGNTATGLKVFLEDGMGKTEIASFTLSSFNSASFTTVVAPLTLTSNFDTSNIIAWDIAGGNPAGINNVRVSLDSIFVVPEPSSIVLLAVAFPSLWGLKKYRYKS